MYLGLEVDLADSKSVLHALSTFPQFQPAGA
jgi:hypothetical protein